MCKCIEKFDKELQKKYPEWENVKLDTIIMFPDCAVFPAIQFTYNKKGQKKKRTMSVKTQYCPFCGKPYKRDKK